MRTKLIIILLLASLSALSQKDETVKSLQIGTAVRVDGIKTVFGPDSTSNKKVPTIKATRDWVNVVRVNLLNYINAVDTIYINETLQVNSGILGVTRSIQQNHTSGSTVTMNNTTTWLKVNPGSTLAALTISFPPEPADGQLIRITFGGTMTTGTVVTSLTMDSGGPGIIQLSAPTLVEVGDVLTYVYSSSPSKWFRL